MDRCPGHGADNAPLQDLRGENSLYNTPPSFGIYVISLVLKWLDEDMGGLEKMAAINRKKADALYGAMEASGGFYRPTADPEDRSNMNVTFRLKEEDLEVKFVAEAQPRAWAGSRATARWAAAGLPSTTPPVRTPSTPWWDSWPISPGATVRRAI